jgi:glycine C-acetyltransferase
MSDQAFYSGLQSKLETLRSDGLFKPERQQLPRPIR